MLQADEIGCGGSGFLVLRQSQSSRIERKQRAWSVACRCGDSRRGCSAASSSSSVLFVFFWGVCVFFLVFLFGRVFQFLPALQQRWTQKDITVLMRYSAAFRQQGRRIRDFS